MIVKIVDVRLYVTPHRGVEEGNRMREALIAAGVPYIEMMYRDKTQLSAVTAAVATWSFGRELRKLETLDFPFVTWDEYHDDFEKPVEIARDVTGLKKLLENKNRVQLS